MFKRILLVNGSDEAQNQKFKDALKDIDPNMAVEVAHNGQQAFDYIKKLRSDRNSWSAKKPDAIFLDLEMPVMSGYDFLMQYNQVFANRKTWIPVWILSADKGQMASSLKKIYTSVKGALDIDNFEASVLNAFAQER